MTDVDTYQDLLPANNGTPSKPSFNSDTSNYTPPGSSDEFPTRQRRGSSSLIPAADVKGVVFNLMNAVIGVGVLAMPYCFKRAGLIIAPLLLFLVGSLTERSLVLMIRAGDILRDGATDTEGGGGSHMAIGYSATVARCFGPQMGTVADIAIVTMNFGSGVAYLDVIADILAAWVGSGSKVIGLFVVIVFVVGPLSCIREIENLKFTSLLGLCIYTLFMLITVVLFFIGVSCGGEAYAPAASSDFLVAIPIQTLAFACHTVVFPVYREFREIPGSTSTSFQHALRLTIGLCATMYIFVGFFGALTFKDNTLGDILKNYSSEGGGLAHFIEAIFAFSICMTYPLIIFPMRDSLDILVMKVEWVKNAARNQGWSSERFSTVRFYSMTIVILLLAFLVAVLIPDIEIVFGLTGCTFGIVICFLLPALMYLKASGTSTGLSRFDAGDKDSDQYTDRRTAMVVLVIGGVLGLASFIMTLVSIASASVEEEGAAGTGGLCGNVTVMGPAPAALWAIEGARN